LAFSIAARCQHRLDEAQDPAIGHTLGYKRKKFLMDDRSKRTHHRLPITKRFKSRPSSHASGIPLKDADFP